MTMINTISKNQLDEMTKVTMAAWAHMLSCTLTLCTKTGEIEANPGIVEAVDNCIQPYFKDLDVFTVSRLAKRAARIGDTCLAAVDAKNEVSRCLGVAKAIMKLVDQQPPIIDPETTLAAAAIGIVMESDDENDEVWRVASHPEGIAKRLLEIFGNEVTKP